MIFGYIIHVPNIVHINIQFGEIATKPPVRWRKPYLRWLIHCVGSGILAPGVCFVGWSGYGAARRVGLLLASMVLPTERLIGRLNTIKKKKTKNMGGMRMLYPQTLNILRNLPNGEWNSIDCNRHQLCLQDGKGQAKMLSQAGWDLGSIGWASFKCSNFPRSSWHMCTLLLFYCWGGCMSAFDSMSTGSQV